MDATRRAHCSLFRALTCDVCADALSADAMASTTRGARSFGTGCVAAEGRGARGGVGQRLSTLGCVGFDFAVRSRIYVGEGFRVVRTAGWASSDAARAEILPA